MIDSYAISPNVILVTIAGMVPAPHLDSSASFRPPRSTRTVLASKKQTKMVLVEIF